MKQGQSHFTQNIITESELDSGLESESTSTRTWPIPVLTENVHYYMEDGYMVFTEDYHKARGVCCGNVCRHCPFDYENVRR